MSACFHPPTHTMRATLQHYGMGKDNTVAEPSMQLRQMMSLKGLRHTNSRSIHLVILNRFPPPLSASYAVNQLAASAYVAIRLE